MPRRTPSGVRGSLTAGASSRGGDGGSAGTQRCPLWTARHGQPVRPIAPNLANVKVPGQAGVRRWRGTAVPHSGWNLDGSAVTVRSRIVAVGHIRARQRLDQCRLWNRNRVIAVGRRSSFPAVSRLPKGMSVLMKSPGRQAPSGRRDTGNDHGGEVVSTGSSTQVTRRGVFPRLRDARIRAKLALILFVPLVAVIALATARLVDVEPDGQRGRPGGEADRAGHRRLDADPAAARRADGRRRLPRRRQRANAGRVQRRGRSSATRRSQTYGDDRRGARRPAGARCRTGWSGSTTT